MQKEPKRFPRELLGMPTKARHAYFRKNCTVRHPQLTAACAELEDLIWRPSDRLLIGLVGPTGVGKSKLRALIEKSVIEQLMPELQADPGRVPFATFSIWAPEVATFSWLDFYTCYLESMQEVLIAHKIARVRNGHEDDKGEIRPAATKTAASNLRRSTTHDLRRAVKDAIDQRRPAVTLVDEAQHLMKMASGGLRMSQQFDVLKSLIDQTQVPHVLIGPYELVKFLNLHGQLSRRSKYVHLQRYHAQDSEQLRQFQSVILAFQRLLPLEEEPDLVKHYQFLYERTLGCVGMLKTLLEDSLHRALKGGARTLTMTHMKHCAESVSKCREILREIKEGESLLAEDSRDRELLLAELGIPQNPPGIGEGESHASPSQTNGTPPAADTGKFPPPGGGNPPRRRPGERKPTRDPVGLPPDQEPPLNQKPPDQSA